MRTDMMTEQPDGGRALIAALVVLFVLCPASWAGAAEVTITPRASASIFADDNVFLEDDEGYGWDYGASLSVLRTTRRSSFSLDSSADFQQFLEESDRNRVNHSHALTFTNLLSRRWTSDTTANIRISDAQQQTLEEEGVRTDDSTRYNIGAGQSFTYAMTKLTTLTGSYNYNTQLNDSDTLADNRSHTGALTLGHTFGPKTSGSITGSYTKASFDEVTEDFEVGLLVAELYALPDGTQQLVLAGGTPPNDGTLVAQGFQNTTLNIITEPEIDEDIYSVNVGINRQMTKRLTMDANLGYSIVDSNIEESNESTVTGGVNGSYMLREGTLSFGYNRSVAQGSFSGSTIRDSALLGFGGIQPLKNLTLGATVTYFKQETVSGTNDDESESVNFNANASYTIPLSRHWSADASYSFLFRRNLLDDTNDTRNRVSLGISWNFPYKL